MAASTVTNLNSLFNTIYEDSLFVAREQNLMVNLVTNYSARGWMNRVIPIYAQITAEAVGENEDFANPTTFSKTAHATLTPGEIMAQVVLTDRRIETDPEDARRDASEELGNAIATKIDTDLVGLFSSFTTTTIGTAGQGLTLNKVAAAQIQIRNQKAPNPLYIVLHPYGWFDIWDELGTPGTNSWQGDIANEALRSFYVGDWLNAQWFVSANISVDASDDAYGGIFNPQALAFDSRKSPLMEPERDASLRAWELNMSAGYAYGIRRQAFGGYLLHDATAPTS